MGVRECECGHESECGNGCENGCVVEVNMGVGVGVGVCEGVGVGKGMVWVEDWLVVYVLATSKVIRGRVPICDSAHSWRLYSAPRYETRPPAPRPATPLSHIILTLSEPVIALP